MELRDRSPLGSEEDEIVAPVRSGSFRIIDARLPVAGEDYPRDPAEAEVMFADEGGCRAYLERLRWPRGFFCVHCGGGSPPWRSGAALLACRDCEGLVAVTHGTIFHGSSLPLRLWLRAMWHLTDSESGASASALRGMLGTRDAQSSAACLAKLRSAMAAASRAKITSPVLLARSYVEVDGSNGTPRRTSVKVPVVLAVERDRGRLARVRLHHSPSPSAAEVTAFARRVIEPGAEIYTGRWEGYGLLGLQGFGHHVGIEANAQPNPDPGHVISLLRLWLWSTAEATAEQLPHLLDEFTFRFDRRTYPRGLLFYRLMILAVHPSADLGDGHGDLAGAAG
jgi:hypothetical protein